MALLGSLCRMSGHCVAGLRIEAPPSHWGAGPWELLLSRTSHNANRMGCRVLIWASAQPCAQEGLDSLTPSLSKISTGFPQAPASGCPSEVVRDHTRDRLGKDKEEIPQPLYLFVSLSAIFACVVVYKVLHDTWSYWLGSLGEISRGTWQQEH